VPSPDRSPYPDARRLDDAEELWGHHVADPYRWLEDPTAPDAAAWSAAEDELWAAWAAGHPERELLTDRILGLSPGFRGAPTTVAGRRFWTQRAPGQDHAVVWVDDDAGARPLVDPNALAADGTVTLDGWAPSIEGDRLAYLLSSGGDEESSLWVRDVATGALVEGPVDRVRYSPLAWLPGGEELLYVRRLAPGAVPAGEEAFHRRAWRHRVGSDPDRDDQLLFGSDGLGPDIDKTAYLGVDVTDDGRWVTVTVSLGTAPRNELWLAELPAPDAAPAWRPVLTGVDAQASPSWDRRNNLWILTDIGAPRRRLVRAHPARPDPADWEEVLGEDPEGGVLESWVLAGEHIVALRSRHSLAEISVHDRATGRHQRDVTLPGPSSADLTGRPDEGEEVWVGLTGYASPYAAAPLDVGDGSLGAFLAAPGPAPDLPAVRSHLVSFRSQDGTEVRMTVVASASGGDSAGGERTRPAVLYGYGGFNVPLSPAYSSTIAAWVAAGGVWAVANLRGGSEEGEAWHRDGMREHKHHVFEDFEAAADRLVAGGWTTHEQLGIFGGSNGGLLVGAALTRSPERYRAVVCSAPLLDMVRYERFGLGATWNDEFGTADDPEELAWLLSYSPYHHVEEGVTYPAVLFTIFDRDTRVDPLHARKMAAALQWATTGPSEGRPVLVRREAEVGHGARSMRRSASLAADELVFLAAHTGLDLGARRSGET
jgi:prolyl oligopeptidase